MTWIDQTADTYLLAKELFLEIEPSPSSAIRGYRNKCEFAIGSESVIKTELESNESEEKSLTKVVEESDSVEIEQQTNKEIITCGEDDTLVIEEKLSCETNVQHPVTTMPVDNASAEKTDNIVVGFMLGSYTSGVTVVNASECLHVSKTSLQIAQWMQDFVIESGLPYYDRVSKTGVWRLLVTRTHISGEGSIL